MKLKETIDSDVAILTISGKMMGGAETQELQDKVKGLLTDGIKKVIIDLGHVGFMNSSGLGSLMACYATLKSGEGQL